jgi:DNA-binding NarL/FixJ family response regulator
VIKVLIADDHMVVRAGLRAILDAEPDMQQVGETSSGEEAIERVRETQPDVVLMDLRMPGMGGLEAIRKIKNQYPDVQVVILTTYDDDSLIVRGLQAGARGYLLKDTPRQVLYDAIRAAARGESLLPENVIDRVVAHLQAPSQPGADILTPREQQVLVLMADGATNREIAYKLSIAERTVKTHVTSLFNKLGANSRVEAVSIALRHGWVGEEKLDM